MAPRREERCWAVVLAAGDGNRLLPLTRALYGESLPKQFASLDGERSLLQETVERVGLLVPPERTVVVVSGRYEALARRQLAAYRGIDIVAQPRNLGTGPGVLLPLARVRAHDPAANVVVFPSDHHVVDPKPIVEALWAALDAAEAGAFHLALVGVTPQRAEPEYGWIVPGTLLREGVHRIAAVERFVEKPSSETATGLMTLGALWNTLICAGRLEDFWSLLGTHLPQHVPAFELYAAHVGEDGTGRLLDLLYEDMDPANLSHDVLARAEGLAVLPVSGSGWSDWGTPERVLQSLAGTPAHARLLLRLSGTRVRRGALAGA